MGPQPGPLRFLRLLDLHHQIGLGPDLGGIRHDRPANRLVLAVGNAAALTGAGLDQDPVPGLA